MLTYEEFRKVKLKIARITHVEEHANADRLYVITIDDGSNISRTIVAGIRMHYKKEELVGRLVVIVDNLQPAAIRGVESNGMLLAATSKSSGIVILQPEKDVEPGSEVK